ncbi:MAG: hypothetical protein D6702_02010 [Planctomycetota bacterium]|nr:MAG: hypothetical protein D6702_02010 [Planctomycetota bacterium]
MTDPLSSNPRDRLGGQERRQHLLQRIESLLSVLLIARRRLQARGSRAGADPIRTSRTLRSLDGTIGICRRARRALLADRPPDLGPAAADAASWDEFLRFRALGPLTRDEIAEVDIDQLCRRLSGQD